MVRRTYGSSVVRGFATRTSPSPSGTNAGVCASMRPRAASARLSSSSRWKCGSSGTELGRYAPSSAGKAS